MKYTETFGHAPTNWYEVVDALESRALSAYEEISYVVDAAQWQTCACGNQDERIARDDVGVPLDTRLQVLGGMFYNTIAAIIKIKKGKRTQSCNYARECLRALDAREQLVLEKQEEDSSLD